MSEALWKGAFAVLTVIAVLWRMLGGDPLCRRLERQTATYWRRCDARTPFSSRW